MFRKIIFPLIACAGIAFCIFMIHYGARTPPVLRILFIPPVSPYRHYVAGEGLVESAYKDIVIGVPFQEVITDIYAQLGSIVKKGDPLFKLDTRHLQAQLAQALQEQYVAQIDFENLKVQFSFYERLEDRSAVSEVAYNTAFYNMKLAQQRLDAAIASVNVIQTDIERSTLRAPIDGEVLQINIRPGQTAILNSFDRKPLILFGDASVYHLRIDIDEEDAWRVIPGAPATAFVRGNSKIFIPLEFVYLEPYIIPKTSLSGSDTERVDTRVLQVVYKFPKKIYPIFAGQLLDVYIQAKQSEVAG